MVVSWGCILLIGFQPNYVGGGALKHQIVIICISIQIILEHLLW